MTAHPLPAPAADPSAQPVPQPSLGHGLDEHSCEVLLIRHGRSADVVPGTAASTDPPLHDVGHAQAAALAERLRDVELSAVVSSHLRRAVATAQPLADQRGLVVEVHRDLEEIRLGDWSRGEFRRRAATADPEWVAWSRTGRWDGIPGCEGDDALRARVGNVIDGLIDAHRGQRIAVVAHGGSINAFVSRVLGVHRSLWMAVENTSVTVIRSSSVAGPTVVSVNDCHHLYDPVVSTGS